MDAKDSRIERRVYLNFTIEFLTTPALDASVQISWTCVNRKAPGSEPLATNIGADIVFRDDIELKASNNIFKASCLYKTTNN